MSITVEVPKSSSGLEDPEEVNIYLNDDGIDYLIRHLKRLKEQDVGEHLHFMSPAWGMDDLSENRIDSSSALIHHLRIGKI